MLNRLLLIAAMLLALGGCATHNTVSDGDDRHLMLKGHDPVSYFMLGKPAPGNPSIKADHEGVTYRFMNEQNRALFVKSPDSYKPQYNGFCANGLVYAIPLGGNHDTYKIIDGRLFMFGGANSKKYFEMDQERHLKLSENYWKTEVQGSIPRLQSWKRLIFKVPHYKTNKELAAEWETRQLKK
ncbi:MAG: YHS domain-containing (seleno)protein [Burkholderiales bacterium]